MPSWSLGTSARWRACQRGSPSHPRPPRRSRRGTLCSSSWPHRGLPCPGTLWVSPAGLLWRPAHTLWPAVAFAVCSTAPFSACSPPTLCTSTTSWAISCMYPCPCAPPAAAPPCIPRAGASFSEDASLLLLVCSGGWALLHAADWDGQGLPAYSHVLHMANSAEGGHAEAELAGGAILSGAMAADRARLDHYYAGGMCLCVCVWWKGG